MQSVKLLFIAFFGLALVVAGCDSQGESTTPAPIDPGPDNGQIELVQPLPDTTLYDSEQAEFDLSDYFRHATGGLLTYTVTQSDPTVQVTYSDAFTRLTLTPYENVITTGSASIMVTATDRTDEQVRDTFVVSVIDDCPAPPDPNLIDYFPLTPGSRWTFDYDRSSEDLYALTLYRGTMTMDFSDDVVCEDFAQTMSLTHAIDGERQYRSVDNPDPDSAPWIPYNDTFSSTLIFDGTDVTINPFGNRDIVSTRYREPSSPDIVDQTEYLGSPDCSHSIYLARGLGMDRYHYGCFSQFGHFLTERTVERVY